MLKLYVNTKSLVDQLAMSWLRDSEHDIEIVVVGDAEQFILEHGITRLPALIKTTETGEKLVVHGFNADAYN